MSKHDILNDARNAPPKSGLEEHKAAILELRKKSYTWREIASFLSERGVKADHTAVYRLITKPKRGFMVPTMQQYREVLSTLDIQDDQRRMLEAHYRAPNRSITFTQLSAAGKPGETTQDYANLRYGKLGRALGDVIGFSFVDAEERPGKLFYSSALGMPDPYPVGKEFQLVMYHSLADAIRTLNWFPE
jgi:hypothetical protein